MNDVRQALEMAPCSDLELGRRAGVSGELVRLVRLGKRRLTPAVAQRLASALEDMGAECLDAAECIRRHTEEG